MEPLTGAEGARPRSDRELVERVCSGDRAAFDALYDRYFRRVYNFCYSRVGDHPTAEEITQETFVQVFSSLASYRGESSVLAWVFGITRNCLSAYWKRESRSIEKTSIDAGALRVASDEPSPEARAESKSRLSAINDEVDRLPPTERRVFRARYIDGEGLGTIAKAIGSSRNAVKSILYRARLRLLGSL